MDVLAIHAKELERCGRPLSREQERRLFQRARKHGDRQAFEQLVHSQLRWVWRIAKRFIGKGIPLEDLIQVGNLGLLRAIEMWQPAKKCRLGTFAYWHIRQGMQRAVSCDVSVVRLPTNPTNYGTERYDALHAAFVRGMRSLDYDTPGEQPLAGRVDRDCRLPPAAAGVEEIYSEQQRRRLRDAIDQLDARQQTLIERRLAGATLQEIADEMVLTQERVRQIERQAMRELVYHCTGRTEGPMPSLADASKVLRRKPVCA